MLNDPRKSSFSYVICWKYARKLLPCP